MVKIIKWTVPIIVAVFVLGIGYSILTRKEAEPGSDGGAPANDGSQKGVSLSPKGFTGADFPDFFEKAKQAGEMVSWAGDWSELGNLEKGGPTVVSTLAATYGYTPVIEAQFFTQSTGKLLRPLDESTKASYKKSATDFVERFRPPSIGFGIEINILYEKSPEDFEKFRQFFGDVSDAIKATSPTTKVFTVFQLEKMKGLNGGLFGGTNDPAKAQWQLLDAFPKADLVAFTTYPGLIYRNPSDIPAAYYTEVQARVAKPIAFSEIGWHSAASPLGWESSEAEQAEFIKTYFRLTREVKKEFAIWSFLYDQRTFEPFTSMGLFSREGKEKSGWNEWTNAKETF